MAKKLSRLPIRGLVTPRPGEELRGIWRAFREGDTWKRTGGMPNRRAIYTHKRYKGRLRLEWWGKAIHFEIHADDASGLLHGAFVGHLVRHNDSSIDRVEVVFP